MNAAAKLIDRARTAGLKLIDRGNKLRVSGPEPLPTDLLDDLREFKGEVLEQLRSQPDPLPPEGGARRAKYELIDQVWAANGWLLISGSGVRAVPRDDSEAPLTPELVASVENRQAELLQALTRIPERREARRVEE